MTKILTLVQWHTEKDGLFTWHEPGEIANIDVPDLPDLIRAGTVTVLETAPLVGLGEQAASAQAEFQQLSAGTSPAAEEGQN